MNEETSALWLGPLHRERWTYACAKQLLERVIFASGRHHGLPFTIVRPFNVIGPRMDFVPDIDGEGIPRVLAAFMSALLRGEEMALVDGGGQRRSFVSVEDFVQAVVRIVERPAACRGEVFNLGNPSNDLSIAELAEQIGRAYQQQVPQARVQTRQVRRRRSTAPATTTATRASPTSTRRSGCWTGRPGPAGRDVAPHRRRLPRPLRARDRRRRRPGRRRGIGAAGAGRG